MLLNTFSELFTGIEVKSAKFDHWKEEMGAGNALTTKKKTDEDKGEGYNQSSTFADVKQKTKVGKTRREAVPMKYSPLVERYLKAHKYETMNNVQEW